MLYMIFVLKQYIFFIYSSIKGVNAILLKKCYKCRLINSNLNFYDI